MIEASFFMEVDSPLHDMDEISRRVLFRFVKTEIHAVNPTCKNGNWIIHGHQYPHTLSSSHLEDIKEEIKNLPQPEVIPMDTIRLKSDDVVLCLQREMAYIDELGYPELKQYLGSKYFAGCMMAYFHTETDHAVIHLDDSPIDLCPLLEKFNDKDNIRVTLVGGRLEKYSEIVLSKIITAILNASRIMKISITIDKQKILEHGLTSKNDIPQKIYDFVVMKFVLLYRKQFNEELPPCDLFDNLSLDDFK